MKTTPWIDGDEKPVRVGVYQKLYCGDVVYAHWNGKFWGMFTGPNCKPDDALQFADNRSMAQRAFWRGLASPSDSSPVGAERKA